MNDTEKISCVEKSNLDILLDMSFYILHKKETHTHTVIFYTRKKQTCIQYTHTHITSEPNAVMTKTWACTLCEEFERADSPASTHTQNTTVVHHPAS